MDPWSLPRRAVKRAVDLVASTVALIALALPLVVISLFVRLTSRGPALFRQERLGRHGRRFRIWKFRTMVLNAASAGRAITAAGDQRVTRLGRFLRRTKLDELPQLVNVWLGDMSLVGPRPEVPRYLPYYAPADQLVLAVRPGITDPASIYFRNEEQVLAGFHDPERAYTDVILPLKLSMSREYVRRQSFGGDLRIIFRTLARL
jgi:lipopolysaccharide/colanic/teichoic acid biosynthesis glycosyltransferase